MLLFQIGVAPLLDRLRKSVVSIRGRVVGNEADPVIKRGKKAQPPTSEEVVRVGLYLRHQVVGVAI